MTNTDLLNDTPSVPPSGALVAVCNHCNSAEAHTLTGEETVNGNRYLFLTCSGCGGESRQDERGVVFEPASTKQLAAAPKPLVCPDCGDDTFTAVYSCLREFSHQYLPDEHEGWNEVELWAGDPEDHDFVHMHCDGCEMELHPNELVAAGQAKEDE